MLKRIIEALSALLTDTPVFNRLLDQMKAWGETQEEARKRLISILSDVVRSFEQAHSIVFIELSRLTNVKTPGQYRSKVEKLDRNKFYRLFKTKDVCDNLHRLEAELASGFGDIQDSVVLGAAKRLKRALGQFEQYEYSLAERYEDYLRTTLFGAHRVNSKEDLEEAISAIVDQEEELVTELRQLTGFKRQILNISLYR